MNTTISTDILSNRISSMPSSATIVMAQKARDLQEQGIDVISLSLGEPDFGTPKHIREAAKKAIDDGYSKYTPVPGYGDLREVICEKFKRDNNLEYSPDQIVVSTGAKQTLANIILCLINPGDEVIMPIPYWVSYAAQIQLAEGKLVEVATSIEDDFKITPQQLENAITDKTKLFIFSSPCNPTGSVYSKSELEGLANVFAKYPKIIVISDEIYEHINFLGKHESIGTFPQIKEQVITVNGLSKGFAMTGWRLGFMGAPLKIAKACSKMQGQFTSGTCAISQRAAIEALTGDMTPTHKMREAFLERRNLVLKGLSEINGVKINEPEGAFYVFPDVSSFIGKKHSEGTIKNVDDLCMYLLNTAHVSLVTGSAFGNKDCLRISYAASKETLTEALIRVKKALDILK